MTTISSSGVLATQYTDDVHDADYVSLVALTVGTGATDLLVDNNVALSYNNQGPSCPDNYTFKIDYIVLTNNAASVTKATIQKVKGAGSPIVIATFYLAANSSIVVDQSSVKLLCQYGYRFQAVASQTSIDVTAYGRLTLGAGL